jgi:dTDP-glucose 4,6-dehydratase (EC 4.2.1.46)
MRSPTPGNLKNLSDVEHEPNYRFVKADIRDAGAIGKIFAEHKPDGVIHLAAESHVDRSISDPLAFRGDQRHRHRQPAERRPGVVEGGPEGQSASTT